MAFAVDNQTSLFLKPGELAVIEVPTQVSTILGSCVAVTFFNQRLKYGAICHAMLPYGRGDSSFRYIDGALDYMLGRFSLARIERHEIEVKLFGGADVLWKSESKYAPLSVGRQNIVAAKALIEHEGLQLQASNVGGALGRKIHFFTHTGEVLLKRVGGDP